MPAPRLSAANASRIVRAANDDAVRAAAFRLGPITARTDTLLPNNGAPFANELAAGQVIHLVEGWRYLAAAVYAYANHSEGAAIHQAYYAELRAALALFAASGIQINNGRNFYIDQSGRKHEFPGKTHTAAWTIWGQWAKERYATKLLKERIRLLPGLVLGEMDADLGGALSVGGVLEKWGYDLLSLSRDHVARNQRSYEPYWSTRSLTAMDAGKVRFIQGLWQLMLPSIGNTLRFDQAYIRYLVYKTGVEVRAQGKWPARWYYSLLMKICNQTGLQLQQVHAALQQAPADGRLFDLAAARDTNPENVLSRALFLLRIATTSTEGSTHVPPAGTAGPTLSWLENWLEHAGLWRRSSGVDRLDAADDYRDAIAGLTAGAPLPETLWDAANARFSGKLCRADACLIWGVL